MQEKNCLPQTQMDWASKPKSLSDTVIFLLLYHHIRHSVECLPIHPFFQLSSFQNPIRMHCNNQSSQYMYPIILDCDSSCTLSLACNFLRTMVADDMIAIEVDGPHHFTANTFQPLGEMLARQKLLEVRGWTVISVPFYHWSNKTLESRRAYLHNVCSAMQSSLL